MSIQTYQEIEIVIVNDGSTDNSNLIIEEFARNNYNVKIVNQKNSGLSAARNSGLAQAKGNYISFVDSDDWLEPNAIEKGIESLRNYNADLVFWPTINEYTDYSLNVQGAFGKDTIFYGDSLNQLKRRTVGPIRDELKNPLLIDSFASAWGKIYKSEIIKINNIQFVDTKIIGSEDVLFNIRYFHSCERIFYLHQHLIHYLKINSSSLTKNHGSTLFPRFKNLFKYINEFINASKLGNEYYEALNNRISISMINIGLSISSPRNTRSFKQKINDISICLNDPQIRHSYKLFKFKYLAIHWKIYYLLCKVRLPGLVYVCLKIMRTKIK